MPESPFPGGRDQEFRVFIAPEVHRTVWEHASGETTVEVCGVLVGRWGRDADGPFVAVVSSIRGEAAENRFAEVTFTHKTWAKINEEMDRNHPELTIVGWYHTHPDFGVFLSDRDLFIQQHFFSGAGQIAQVVDPVRRTEGVFVWKQGKPTLTPHFWVGTELKSAAALSAETAPAGSNPAAARGVRGGDGAQPSWWLLVERLLAYAALLLIGYLLAGLRSSWERTRLIEGVVAHYGVWQGLRPGLGEAVDQVSARLRTAQRRAEALSAHHLKRIGKNDDARSTASDWLTVRTALGESSEILNRIKAKYALSPTEALLVQEQILDRLGAASAPPARRPEPAPPEPAKKPRGKTGS